MARIPPISIEAAAPEARRDLERQLAAHGRVTNMKTAPWPVRRPPCGR